jgi:hypothetical protein
MYLLEKDSESNTTTNCETVTDNSEKNISTTSTSTSVTAASHARGLDAAYSRKLSAMLGGSTSTHLGVQKITLKTCNFVDISNTPITTTLGDSTTTLPPIVDTILRQQLDYVIVDYGRAAHGAPDKKLSFSLPEVDYYLPFATPDTRRLRYEKLSCISLTSKKLRKP